MYSMCASHRQSLRRIFKAGTFFRSVQYPAYETFSNYRKLKLMLSLPPPLSSYFHSCLLPWKRKKYNAFLLVIWLVHRVLYTQWQWPLSDVHSIMIVKSAQNGEGGGLTSTPFTISTIMCKVVVYAPAERVDTLPLFLLYLYMYSVD